MLSLRMMILITFHLIFRGYKSYNELIIHKISWLFCEQIVNEP